MLSTVMMRVENCAAQYCDDVCAEECAVRDSYRRCDRCTEAVPRREHRAHQAAGACAGNFYCYNYY